MADLELTNLLPVLEFLAYTKDIRKHMNKFIINNNISYQEAFNVICCMTEESDNENENVTVENRKSLTQGNNNNNNK